MPVRSLIGIRIGTGMVRWPQPLRRGGCRRKKLMATTRNITGLNRGWRGRRDRREGGNQRRIRRAFAYADVLTTRELLSHAYPRIKFGSRVPEWRLAMVRASLSMCGTNITSAFEAALLAVDGL